MLLRYVYILFIGVLLALFVGVGIDAFYKAPEYPRMIPVAPIKSEVTSQSAEEVKQIQAFERENEAYQKRNDKYNRDVSVIALGAALLFLMVGLVFAKQLSLIADGLVVGGVFTLLYSVARSFNGNDDLYRFLAVSVGLIVALTSGYIKFIRQNLGK